MVPTYYTRVQIFIIRVVDVLHQRRNVVLIADALRALSRHEVVHIFTSLKNDVGTSWLLLSANVQLVSANGITTIREFNDKVLILR